VASSITPSDRASRSRTPKPESFNSRVRDELLNQHCFTSVRHAQDLLEDWQTDYNTVRPHTALGGLAPATFLAEQAGLHGARPARSLTPDTRLQPAVATP
jgi:putative transposase